MRAIVTEPAAPPAARAPPRALDGAIVYELHVGGFTRDPSSGVRNPGTFAGLIEKIPYLKDLGITHVELLPVMAFDEQDVPDAALARGLRNYWGYSTHSFFSPHPRYCVNPADAPSGVPGVDGRFTRGGDRRAPRRRVQPHGRRRRPRPGDQLQGPRKRRLLPPRCHGQAPLSRLHGMRQHRELQPSARDQLHRPLPRVLGGGARRGRLSLRPGERVHARSGRRAHGRSARAVGDRVIPYARARAGRRRGLGRSGALPRRRIPRHGMGGVERPLPRRHATVRAWRPQPARRGRVAHRRQCGSLRGRRAAPV